MFFVKFSKENLPEDDSSIQSCDHGLVSAAARSSASLMSPALTRSGPLRMCVDIALSGRATEPMQFGACIEVLAPSRLHFFQPSAAWIITDCGGSSSAHRSSSFAPFRSCGDLFRSTPINRHLQEPVGMSQTCDYRKPVDLSITSSAHYLALRLRTCASSILKKWSRSSNSPLRSTSAR
jgi:hypothetical protein